METDANGNHYVNKWDSQNSAEAQRFRRPAVIEMLANREEADQWIANDLGSSDGGDGGNGGGGNPPSEPPTTPPTSAPARQAPAVPPSGTNVTEWVVDNYGDLSVDDVEEVVIGQGYTEVTQHLIDTLELKRAWENGFTEMGALPAFFGPTPPPGVVVDSNAPIGGVNPNRRVRLSDGTVGYLKRIGMGQREVFNELASARMFEALGIDDLVITSVIDPLTGDLSVLSREIPHDGRGDAFRGNVEDLKNVREMALIDFLISNGDRHPGNWLFKGDTAYPIDHGYSHALGNVPTDLNNFGYSTSYDMREDIGQFGNLITEWASGGNPDLFTQEEFVAIRDKIMGLKDMYEAAGPFFSGYFSNLIAPKLDFLMGIWS